MTNRPKVTVLVPVYNREHYVRDAIDSILAQTFTDFELLVIDDGSTDRSSEVVRSYQDPRIRFVGNEMNEGIPKTRNKGVQLARGEYLALLDSDDRAFPERLATQVAFLDSHPDFAAVGAWIEWMDEVGRPLGRVKRRAVSPDEIAALRLFRSCLENSASMARTAVVREYGYREDYAVSEDFDLWSRIAAKHKLATLPRVLVYRRLHSGQVTHEQTPRAQEWSLAIYASQLQALGITFTDTDLERHLMLRRMKKLRFTPDRIYLKWAEDWLRRLQAANRTALCYPEPSFSQVLGRFWFNVCWYASADLGLRAWLYFARSPLRKNVWSGLRSRFPSRSQLFSRG
jgi:glycosyltransferase involved in cell wall biosynthesis